MLRKHKIFAAIAVVVVLIAVSVTVVLALPASSKDTSTKINGVGLEVDEDNDTFLLNGQPFRYVSGSFHYFRAHEDTWREKLRTMRSAGLNAVDLYVYWAMHNPHKDEYNFDGMANVTKFVELAQEEDLYVILRPGPYICAEIDNGGLPHWLFKEYPNIEVRTSDRDYQYEVSRWFNVLMPMFEKFLITNGGKIIMVQIENEYAIYNKCDKEHLEFLRDETRKYVDENVLLFTTDIPNGTVSCGTVDGAYATIDFGADRGRVEMDYLWETMRTIQPKGPLVNSEYYPGWLTHWQEENQVRDGELIANVLDMMLERGANVNFYMFFGGTNFGFTAGANDWGIGSYKADITSYDYDAPMTEAGDPTIKFTKIKDVISKYFTLPDIETPKIKTKMSLPEFKLNPISYLLSDNGRKALAKEAVFNEKPLKFEELDQFSGFVLYETDLPPLAFDPTQLVIESVRDRALIFIDQQYVGTIARENNVNQVALPKGWGNKLQILVENMGRTNFNYLKDKKGILGDIYTINYDGNKEMIKNWNSIGFPFENYSDMEKLITDCKNCEVNVRPNGILYDGPVIFHSVFNINSDEIYDTYLDVSGWSKGFVFINGFNIGRYWPIVGPQVSLYVPLQLLKKGENTIVVVEYQKAKSDHMIKFVDKAMWI